MTDIQLLLKTIKFIAHVILENGGETYRAEESCERICRAMGYDQVDTIAIPTGIFITITNEDKQQYTAVRRVRKRTINLDKINKANDISRALTKREMTLEEAIVDLEEMLKPPTKGSLITAVCAGASSSLFTLLFGGGWFDFIVAFIIGVVVEFMSNIFSRIESYHFLISIIGSMFITLLAISSVKVFNMGNYSPIIMGSIIQLLPGLSMINAIRDTLRGDLVSGNARATEALIVASSIAVGTGSVMMIFVALGGVL